MVSLLHTRMFTLPWALIGQIFGAHLMKNCKQYAFNWYTYFLGCKRTVISALHLSMWGKWLTSPLFMLLSPVLRKSIASKCVFDLFTELFSPGVYKDIASTCAFYFLCCIQIHCTKMCSCPFYGAFVSKLFFCGALFSCCIPRHSH